MYTKSVKELDEIYEKNLPPFRTLKPRPNTAHERNKLRRILLRLQVRQADVTRALAKMMAATGKWYPWWDMELEPEEGPTDQPGG